MTLAAGEILIPPKVLIQSGFEHADFSLKAKTEHLSSLTPWIVLQFRDSTAVVRIQNVFAAFHPGRAFGLAEQTEHEELRKHFCFNNLQDKHIVKICSGSLLSGELGCSLYRVLPSKTS